ncbi:MAG: metallophosphoesterase family protein [Thermoanaerobaculia bacterium]
MRYLIISDIHGNLQALNALLEATRKKKFQKILLLGDLVGYGANPNEVIETIREDKRILKIVRGNHDRVVLEEGTENTFNLPAMAAILWTRKNLKEENLNFLKTLSPGPVKIENFLICHGSPIDEDLYILSSYEAYESFMKTKEKIIFFGHSHIPSVFIFEKSKISGYLMKGDYLHLNLQKNLRYLINPGSVGQPRDGNPKLSFIIFDSKKYSLTLYRIPYDFKMAMKSIMEAGLPIHLASRLERGL